MKRNYLDFETFKKQTLKNPRIKSEYDRLEPQFAVIDAILHARREKNITQEELAKKAGTKQSAIARVEGGNANPSIKFLQRIASALDKKLIIQFK